MRVFSYFMRNWWHCFKLSFRKYRVPGSISFGASGSGPEEEEEEEEDPDLIGKPPIKCFENILTVSSKKEENNTKNNLKRVVLLSVFFYQKRIPMYSAFTTIACFLVVWAIYTGLVLYNINVEYLKNRPGLFESLLPSISNYASYESAFLFVIVWTQITCNSLNIDSVCSKNSFNANNLRYAIMITLIPWLLLFGFLMCFFRMKGEMIYSISSLNLNIPLQVLNIVEGIKKPFSNVYGYYLIRWTSDVNAIFHALLMVPDAQAMLEPKTGDVTMLRTYEMIQNIYKDESLIIASMFPSNFERRFEELSVIFKKDSDGNVSPTLKKELERLVYRRDYTGNCVWYLYTGLLIVLYTQYLIATYSCELSHEDLVKNKEDKANT